MKIQDLLRNWEGDASEPRTADQYCLRLPIYEAAKIHALAEIFPGRTAEQLMTDLLAAALDELQAHLPYVKGGKVTAHDEQGDPIYEDAGPGPRFHRLTEAYARQLRAQLADAAPRAAARPTKRSKPTAAKRRR